MEKDKEVKDEKAEKKQECKKEKCAEKKAEEGEKSAEALAAQKAELDEKKQEAGNKLEEKKETLQMSHIGVVAKLAGLAALCKELVKKSEASKHRDRESVIRVIRTMK